jgi:hypothetical protein
MHLSPTLMVHLNIAIIRLTMTLRSIRFLSYSTTYNRYSLTRITSGRLRYTVIPLHPKRRPSIAVKRRLKLL